MRDLLPIICSGQASKGGWIQLIHGSRPRGVRSRPPDARGVATPRASAQTLIRSGLTDHARGRAVTRDTKKAIDSVLNQESSLAIDRSRRLTAPTPHPALRATFPRKGGRENAWPTIALPTSRGRNAARA